MLKQDSVEEVTYDATDSNLIADALTLVLADETAGIGNEGDIIKEEYHTDQKRSSDEKKATL